MLVVIFTLMHLTNDVFQSNLQCKNNLVIHRFTDFKLATYLLIGLLTELFLFLNHNAHVLMNSTGQFQLQTVRLGGDVTEHLIVRENAVSVQRSVVLNTLPSKRHLKHKTAFSIEFNMKSIKFNTFSFYNCEYVIKTEKEKSV